MPVVQIEILGRRYALQSDRNPEHVREVASFVDGHLRQAAGGNGDAVRRDEAILAALNIASELFRFKEENGALASSVDRRLRSVIALIDKSVDGMSEGEVSPTG